MTKFIFLSLLSATVLTCVTAAPLASQSVEERKAAWLRAQEVQRRTDCRLAHQVLTLGQPADRWEWALQLTSSCGALGGEALAHQLRQHSSVTAPGGELEKVVVSTAGFRDHHVFSTALAIATDPSAATVARVQSVRVLYFQLNPSNWDPYESFLPDTYTAYMPTTQKPSQGEPYKVDPAQTVLRAMEALLARADTQEPLRTAAIKLHASTQTRVQCAVVSTLEACWNRLRKH